MEFQSHTERMIWCSAFASVVGGVSYDRERLPSVAAARAADAVKAYRALQAAKED